MTGDNDNRPLPTAPLSVGQRQRAECLRLALVLVAGRSVHIQIVERLAHWLYDGGGDT